MKEKWKDVVGYEDLYQVSNRGQVKRNNKILRFNQNRNKYLAVSLSKHGVVKTFRIHRLVALAFIERKDSKKNVVNHLDGNRTNNRVENLRWSTISENHLHAYQVLGKKPTRAHKGKFGKEHNRSKSFNLTFPNKDPVFCGSGLEALRVFGVDNTSISWALNNKRLPYTFKRGKLKGVTLNKDENNIDGRK